MKKNTFLMLLLVLVVTITLTGCGSSDLNTGIHLESGVIDTGYEGIPDPKLIVKMKLTPEEEQGSFEKVPVVTSSSKEDLGATSAAQMEGEEDEGSSTPRPKI